VFAAIDIEEAGWHETFEVVGGVHVDQGANVSCGVDEGMVKTWMAEEFARRVHAKV